MITKKDHESQYINLIETTRKEVINWIMKIIQQQKISPFEKGPVTAIIVREAIGAKNGKAKSISFRGLTPAQTKELLLKNITP